MNSENLGGQDKLEALVLLDTASKSIPMREATQIVMALQNLYDDVTCQDHKDALLAAINKYKTEIRVSSYGFPEEVVTLRDFLKSLNIPTSGIDEEKLDLKLTVGIDDGMGYTPSGFQEVTDSYLDLDKGEIRLWV